MNIQSSFLTRLSKRLFSLLRLVSSVVLLLSTVHVRAVNQELSASTVVKESKDINCHQFFCFSKNRIHI